MEYTFQFPFPQHVLLLMDFVFICPNIFIFLLLKVIDEQTLQSCEVVNQSSDYDSTETDESKEELRDYDTKEFLTGKKIMMKLFWK